MNTDSNTAHQVPQKTGCLKIGLIMLATVIISVIATIFILNTYIFPKQFKPVELNQKEESQLNQKLRQFGLSGLAQNTPANKEPEPLTPQPYTETGAKREVSFSEKELNAMLANNTDLADKVAIDLADNLASANVIMPLDPDFPFLGGKTLKANAGMELAYQNNRPVVILKGVSLWGVPLPNAWLGNLKNVDLVREFGGNEGFWKSFADGVDHIEVREGHLHIKLKE